VFNASTFLVKSDMCILRLVCSSHVRNTTRQILYSKWMLPAN